MGEAVPPKPEPPGLEKMAPELQPQPMPKLERTVTTAPVVPTDEQVAAFLADEYESKQAKRARPSGWR